MSFYCFSSAHVCVVDEKGEEELSKCKAESFVDGQSRSLERLFRLFINPFWPQAIDKGTCFRLLFWFPTTRIFTHRNLFIFSWEFVRVLRCQSSCTTMKIHSICTTQSAHNGALKSFTNWWIYQSKSAKFSESKAINSRRHFRCTFSPALIWISCFCFCLFLRFLDVLLLSCATINVIVIIKRVKEFYQHLFYVEQIW